MLSCFHSNTCSILSGHYDYIVHAINVDLVPSQEILPRVQSKMVGQDAHFLCPSDLGDWLFNDTILPQNTKLWRTRVGTTLKIQDINLANDGIYSCIWRQKENFYYDKVPLIVVKGKL